MDQVTGDPKTIFDAIVADVEMRKMTREFDAVDHAGTGDPTPQQCADAAAIMAQARELRRILRS
jgi:hypothetical protein